MHLVPPPPVVAALAAALLLPLLLALLSHGPWRVPAPGRRFAVAAAATAACWAASLALFLPFDAADAAAGGLLLFAALLGGFTAWTLLAWGFTLSLLLALGRAGRPLSLPEWVSEYADGRTAEAFAEDRVGVLLRLGMARRQGRRVVMTPRLGRRTARVARLLRTLFGLEP